MTPQEAIKILKNLCEIHKSKANVEPITAINLGIEALKRITRDREGIITFPDEILPGETK